MRPVVTADEMRVADEATIAGGTSGETLMERAGHAVARAVLDALPRRYGSRVTVVCGKGNNGGDGFVAARFLRAEGVAVRCVSLVAPDEVRGPARHHLDALVVSGGRVEPWDAQTLWGADVVVDAILGTGVSDAPRGDAAEAIAAINDGDAVVIAVDVPSGVDATSGAVPGEAVRAGTTVTVEATKWGLLVGEGAVHAGTIRVAPVGIEVRSSSGAIVEEADVAATLPARPRSAHKGSAGSVALLAGSDAVRGAPVLTTLGALRAGAGYVRLGCTAGVRDTAAHVAELLIEVVTDGDVLDASSWERFDPALERSDVVALGPGIGTGDPQRELVTRALESFDGPVVLDADALNVLAQDPGPLRARSAPTVLTPHPAEMGRLLGSTAAEVQADRRGTVREAARRFGAICVLKGHNTLVAAPGDDTVYVVGEGGPELATAGTGDVLTGALATLLAVCHDPLHATLAAVLLHGRAGRLAARGRGTEGVVAGDVAAALGPARRDLRAARH